MATSVASIVAIATALASAVPTWAAEYPPIGVRDIVGAIRLTEPALKMSATSALKWAVSPDGRHLAYVTSQGDLARNKVLYRLIHHDLTGVREFLSSDRTSPPSGDVLVEFSSSSNFVFQHAIRQLAWLDDNQTLAFLGEDEDRPTQVYTFHLPSRRLVQITDHERPVLAFVHDAGRNRTLYLSTLLAINYDSQAPAYVVDNGSLNMMLFPSRGELKPPRYQFYVQCLPSKKETGVPTPPHIQPVSEPFNGMIPSNIRLSPEGRYAIASLAVNDIVRINQWATAYDAIRRVSAVVDQIEGHDPYLSSFGPTSITQFVIMDLETGRNAPVFDAPDGNGLSGFAVEAAWLPDGRHAILANTLLPLDVHDASEQRHRRSVPAIVEYELGTQRARRIVDLPVHTRPGMRRFTGIELIQPNRLIVHWSSGPASIFEKRRNSWVAIGDAVAATEAMPGSGLRVQLSVVQSMNTPPRIMAKDRVTGREKVLFDLGVQFRERKLARVEEFQWTDKDGKEWAGGLMYPPEAKTGAKLPLLVQTYGFDREQFVLDGFRDTSSAYAAQAMAGRGMLVLLLPQSSDGEHSQAGLRRYQAGIEAAIDALDRRGLIDTKRVGIIGFSAMGNVARHMITFSDYHFAAATIADSWSFTLFGYVAYLYGFLFSMESAEQVTEAVPWGPSLPTWVASDPSFHTDRVRSAVRIEQYGIGVSPFWDLYALLRRQHKPAELVVFTNGHHQLRQPLQRQISLEGNVDWFAFWLMGQEDPSPAKAEQFERWRQMRTLREAYSEMARHSIGSLVAH